MRALVAWRDGFRRVASAPALVVAAWLATTIVSLPFAVAIRGDIMRSLGTSTSADAAARGMNYEWMQEFGTHASGLATTFRPTIVGFAAVLDNLSAYLDGVQRPTAVAAAAVLYALCWAFLSGGVIERYATRRTTRVPEFFSACGRYFGRFVRLEIATAIVSGGIVVFVHRWIFSTLYPRAVRDVGVERTAFLIRVAFYLVFVLALATANIVVDFAKVRAVLEDRRSMLMAIAASFRFIRRNAGTAVGVYLLNAAAFVLVLAAYSLVAPGGGGAGGMVWAAVLIGQAYITARLCVRLLFFATETALFQHRND